MERKAGEEERKEGGREREGGGREGWREGKEGGRGKREREGEGGKGRREREGERKEGEGKRKKVREGATWRKARSLGFSFMHILYIHVYTGAAKSLHLVAKTERAINRKGDVYTDMIHTSP